MIMPDVGSLSISSESSSASHTTQFISIQFPYSDLVDAVRPENNVEAIYVHECPKFKGTNPSADANRLQPPRGTQPRASLNPSPPSGASRASADKKELLASIMRKDPILRKQGIRVIFDSNLHLDLDASLRRKIVGHQDPAFMTDWVLALRNEVQVLAGGTFVDEPTVTGVFRTTIYHLCNLFVQHSANFLDHAGAATCGSWEDPLTSPNAILDVACFLEGICICGAEHKRAKVCTTDHVILIQAKAAQARFNGDNGIHVKLNNDRVVFEHLGGNSSHEHFLSQVSTCDDRDPLICLTSDNYTNICKQDYLQRPVQL